MKDPGVSVYTALYDLLNGNVTVGAKTLPVYSFVPNDVQDGYVYLSEFSFNEDDTKDRFMSLGNMQIQIALPIEGPKGSRKELQEFSNVVLNLIRPNVNSKLDLAPNFSNPYLYAQSVRDFTNIFDDDRTLRKVIQLVIGIEEL